jgi:hypothetical protein
MIARRWLFVAITLVFAQVIAFAATEEDEYYYDDVDDSLGGILIDLDETEPINDGDTFHIHGAYEGPEPTDPFPDWAYLKLVFYPESGIITEAELYMLPTTTDNNNDTDNWQRKDQISEDITAADTGVFNIAAEDTRYTLPEDLDVSFYIQYTQDSVENNSETFKIRFDNNAPDLPTNILLEPGDTAIDVTWDRPPDDDIAGYYIYWYGQDFVTDAGLMNQALAADVKSENVGYRTDYTIDDLTNNLNIFVAVRAYDYAHNISNFPQPVSDESYDTFGLNLLGDNNEGCFIATAAYGERDPALSVLREFRDSFLITNLAGQLVVAAYYRFSPPLAGWIANNPTARSFTRTLLEPLVKSAESANRHPVVFVLLLFLSLASLLLFTIFTIAKYRGERR